MKTIVLFVLLSCGILTAITCKNRTFSNPVDTSVTLAPPSALKIASITESAVFLTWKIDPPNSEYPTVPIFILIERKSDAAGFTVVDTVGPEVTAAAVAGVYTAGVSYSFQIRLVADKNNSTTSNIAADSLVFRAPSDLQLSPFTENAATLRWTDNSAFETGFQIYRSVDGGSYTIVDSAGAGSTTKSVEGIFLPGVAYAFKVRARAVNNISEFSTPVVQTCVLAAPSGLVVSSVTDSTAMLTWIDNSTFETGFRIEQSTGGGNFVQVDSTAANIITKTVRGVYQRFVTYAFRIRAASVYHTSGVSNSAAGTIPTGDNSMIRITGGVFRMGDDQGIANEKPAHAVTLGAFSMDKTEITFEKWTAVCVWGRAHKYTDLPAGQNGSSSSGTGNPVTKVNWDDAVKWCNARAEMDSLTPVYYTNKLQTTVYRTGPSVLGSDTVNAEAVKWTASGYRLPTEAEWEFAARGGTMSNNYIFSGGDNQYDVAWFSANSNNTTHPVGVKLPNELGLYDMSGNVEEWCWDYWFDTYIGIAQTDPKGPVFGSFRVLRGGTYDDIAQPGFDLRVVYRDSRGGTVSAPNTGFRCVHH